MYTKNGENTKRQLNRFVYIPCPIWVSIQTNHSQRIVFSQPTAELVDELVSVAEKGVTSGPVVPKSLHIGDNQRINAVPVNELFALVVRVNLATRLITSIMKINIV